MRDGLRHKIPKLPRVVHLSQMAQLMHHNIVYEVIRQVRDAGIEAEILFPRTASPPRLHRLYLYIVKIALIVLVEEINFRFNHAQNRIMGTVH